MTSDAQYAHRTATACHMSSADSKHQSCNYYMSKHAVTTGQLYNLRIVNTECGMDPSAHTLHRVRSGSQRTPHNTQIAACRIDDGQAYFQNARTQVSNTRFIQYDFHNQVTLVATRVDDDFAAFIFTGKPDHEDSYRSVDAELRVPKQHCRLHLGFCLEDALVG